MLLLLGFPVPEIIRIPSGLVSDRRWWRRGVVIRDHSRDDLVLLAVTLLASDEIGLRVLLPGTDHGTVHDHIGAGLVAQDLFGNEATTVVVDFVDFLKKRKSYLEGY